VSAHSAGAYTATLLVMVNLFACEVARLEDDRTLWLVLDCSLNYAVVLLVKISSELLPFSKRKLTFAL
jgi:hypothetical protein